MLAGDAEEADMPTESEWHEIRQSLNAAGAAEADVAPTTISDGSEAVQIQMMRETPDGGNVSSHVLIVPKGDSAMMMMYAVPTEEGDNSGWSTLTSSVSYAGGGFPLWIIPVGGILLFLVFWMVKTGPSQPVGRVVVQDGGFRGTGPSSDPAMSRPAFSGGQLPTAGSAMPPPGSRPAPATHVPGVPTPTGGSPDPSPQIPGLRSTLPPSGRWGK